MNRQLIQFVLKSLRAPHGMDPSAYMAFEEYLNSIRVKIPDYINNAIVHRPDCITMDENLFHPPIIPTTNGRLFQKLDHSSQLTAEYPFFEDYFEEGSPVYDPDLLNERVQFIRELHVEMIDRIEVLSEFSDDHEDCWDVNVYFVTGDILSIGVYWTQPTVVEEPSCMVEYLHDNLRDDLLD